MSTKVFALIATCFVAAAQEPGRGVNFYTKDKELALGRMMADDFRKRHARVDNAAVSEYVRGLAAQLAAHVTDLAPLQVELTIDTDTVTAPMQEPVAFSGGFIFVRTGLFLAARGESEFASMLAHAIAHVAERHGTRQATRGQIVNMASVPLIYMGHSHAYGVVPMGFLKFARAFELEADKLAVGITAAAGYDPAALIRYVNRMQVDRGDPNTSALPPVAERIAALTEAVRALPQRTYPARGGFAAAREEVQRLMNQQTEPPTLRRNTPE